MGRFLCAALLCMLLFFTAAEPVGRDDLQAQPVFFSLLFPQLMPGFDWPFSDKQESGEGMVFL